MFQIRLLRLMFCLAQVSLTTMLHTFVSTSVLSVFQPCYKMIRNEREFDEQKFLQDFSELPFNLICSTDNIDDKLDLFNSLFTTCLDRQKCPVY